MKTAHRKMLSVTVWILVFGIAIASLLDSFRQRMAVNYAFQECRSVEALLAAYEYNGPDERLKILSQLVEYSARVDQRPRTHLNYILSFTVSNAVERLRQTGKRSVVEDGRVSRRDDVNSSIVTNR
jgi:hypothetical protein